MTQPEDTSVNRPYAQFPAALSGFDIGGNAFVNQPVTVSKSWPGTQVITVTGAVDRIYAQPISGQFAVIDARTTTKTVLVQGSRANAAPVGTYAAVPAGAYGFLLSTSSGWFFVTSSATPPGPVPTTLTDLWVAPITGSDTTGDGSQTSPFKTLRKAQNVIGYDPIFYASFTLHITEDCSESASFFWTAGAPNINLQIVGSETVTLTKVLTAVTNRVAATNTRQLMDDGATDWTASIGFMVRDATVGARFDTRSWILANNGGGVAEIDAWDLADVSGPVVLTSETKPIVGDTVEVVTFPAMSGNISLRLSGVVQAVGLVKTLDFRGRLALGTTGPACYALQCLLEVGGGNAIFENVVLENCRQTSGAPGFLGQNAIIAGHADTTDYTVSGGAHLAVSRGFVAKGVLFKASDAGTYVSVAAGGFASYDWPSGDAWAVQRGAVITPLGAAALWGSSTNLSTGLLQVVDYGAFDLASGTTWALTVPATGTSATPISVGARDFTTFPSGLVLPEQGIDGQYTIKVPVVANGVSTTFDSAETIPADAEITSSWFKASVAFSPGTQVTMGRPGATTEFVAAADAFNVDDATLPLFEKDQLTTPAAAGVLRVSLSGAAAVGTGVGFLFLSAPKS